MPRPRRAGDAGGMTTETVPPETPATSQSSQTSEPAPRALRRSRRRLLGGVCGGLATYTGIDVTVVRLLLVLLTVIFGMGVAVYVAAWLLVPNEGSDRSQVERMLGR